MIYINFINTYPGSFFTYNQEKLVDSDFVHPCYLLDFKNLFNYAYYLQFANKTSLTVHNSKLWVL